MTCLCMYESQIYMYVPMKQYFEVLDILLTVSTSYEHTWFPLTPICFFQMPTTKSQWQTNNLGEEITIDENYYWANITRYFSLCCDNFVFTFPNGFSHEARILLYDMTLNSYINTLRECIVKVYTPLQGENIYIDVRKASNFI